MTSLDKRQWVMLIVLDLSAAFDTIEHQVLFDCLQTRLEIKGQAFNWIKSYLINRSQSVSI